MYLTFLKQFVIHFEAKYTDFAIHMYTEVLKILRYRRLIYCSLCSAPIRNYYQLCHYLLLFHN
jgi:hypothetical protein